MPLNSENLDDPSQADIGGLSGKNVAEQNERQLRLILDHSPTFIAYISKDLICEYANHNYCKYWGRRLNEIVGKPICEVIGDGSFKNSAETFRLVLKGQKIEYRVTSDHSGRTRIMDVQYVPNFNESDDVVGFFLFGDDITAERESQRRLQLILDSLPAMVLLLNRDERIVFGNRSALELIGVAPEQVRATTGSEFFGPEGYAVAKPFLDAAFAGKPQVFENNVYNQLGQAVDLQVHLVPEADPRDKVVGLFVMSFDITSLKKAELDAAKQVQLRDRFLAILSHELRNPLTAITHSTYFVKTRSELDSQTHDVVNIIDRQSRQMARLLDDLLDVSRITRDQIVFERKVYDFSQTINHVVDEWRPTFEKNKQSLECRLAPSPIPVNGDAGRLHQALTNLLDNAAKYTQPGGRIRLQSAIQQGRVIVSVVDNGHGIPAENIDRIFEMFYQEVQPSNTVKGGLGVGLYLVRRIITHHGGEIVALSPGSGNGSEFRLWLPISDQGVDADSVATQRDFENVSLALVEDHDDSRIVLSQSLKDRGFVVSEFCDGESALARIRDNPPQIAVIDIGLPSQNGLSIARELRSHAMTKDILLIALTGYGQEVYRRSALEAGFDIHLIKPIDVPKLCNLISEQLETKR